MAHRSHWLVFSLVAALSCSLLTDTVAAATSSTRPKLANIFLPWSITQKQAISLSQWDIVILDAEVGARQPKLIQLMRRRNPRIKVFAYVSAVEIHPLNDDLLKQAPLRGKLQARLSDSIFLHRANTDRVSFWQPNYMLNISSDWKYILPQFIQEEILSTKIWDGIMLDNVWDGITWYVGDVDTNNDGVVDDATLANAAWEQNMHDMIADIRARAPHTLLIANGSPKYTELDGIVFENFPKYGWLETMDAIRAFRNAHIGPSIIIINTNQDNNAATAPKNLARFGLASALIADAYYSFDVGDKDHSSVTWLNDYNTKIGTPRADGYQVTAQVWQRNFTNVTVIADYALGIGYFKKVSTPRAR